MNIGDRFSLRLALPHRVEATIVSADEHTVVAECVHRCDPPCYLLSMRETLPIEGRIRYRYDDFARLFMPMAENALALPSSNAISI